jgi:hypothetical protein
MPRSAEASPKGAPKQLKLVSVEEMLEPRIADGR